MYPNTASRRRHVHPRLRAVAWASMRSDGRQADELRPISIQRQFTQTPAGSVLWKQGKTVVLCTVSIAAELPPWFGEDRAGGWVTAEYVMLPGSTPQRKAWPRIGHTDSRGTEIQRLIGRSLRAAIDLAKIGPHTLAVDCQVLQADGGTRTACISAAYVALRDAVTKLPAQMPIPKMLGKSAADPVTGKVLPRYDASLYAPAAAMVDQLGAISVGIVDGQILLDLDYDDDSRAEVDLNIACTGSGKFVEVQASAENGLGFDRARLDEMLNVAASGCRKVMEHQRQALEESSSRISTRIEP
jgi:ribonuclease PH